MTITLAPPPFLQFFNPNNSGSPASGFKLFTYAAGTTTKQATWTDSTQTVQNANPIVLDGNGIATVWGDPTVGYKFVLTTPNDSDPPSSPLRTTDNLFFPITSSFAISPNYPVTTAEINAAVIITSTAYPVGYLERYGGGVASTAVQNNTALSAAIAVMTAQVGGTIYAVAPGVYTFSGAFSLPRYTVIQGGGYCTTWSYTGIGTFLTIGSTLSGRIDIRDLQIVSNGQIGVGLQLGDAGGNGSWVRLFKVLFTGWATAMRVGGATWFSAEKCEFGNASGNSLGSITNGVGIDFNFFGSQNYTSAMTFKDCVISNNAKAGVAATNTSITMNQIVWINCTCQNNCQTTTSNPQFYMGLCDGFAIDNLYIEYVLGGTAPDAIRVDGLGNGRIAAPYINTCATGIRDVGGGSVGQVDIFGGQIISPATAAVNMASETDVQIRDMSVGGGSVTLTGVGCSYLATGSGLASWPHNEGTIVPTPALTFGGGSITQTTATNVYSQVGNVVTLNIKITWSAISSPTSTVSLTNLPAAKYDTVIPLFFSGITVSAGSLVLFIAATNTTGTIYNVQSTTAVLQGTALATSGEVLVTGSYQV